MQQSDFFLKVITGFMIKAVHSSLRKLHIIKMQNVILINREPLS